MSDAPLADQAKRLEADLHSTQERSRRDISELQRQLSESSAQWSAERELLVQKITSVEAHLSEVQHKESQEKTIFLKVRLSAHLLRVV